MREDEFKISYSSIGSGNLYKLLYEKVIRNYLLFLFLLLLIKYFYRNQ